MNSTYPSRLKRSTQRSRRLFRLVFALSLLAVAAAVSLPAFPHATGASFGFAQDFPAAPADRTLVYTTDAGGALFALPFETAMTPLRADAVARDDRESYVELKGASAATVLSVNEPRIYLFVPDQPEAHPPFLVRLTERRGARRITVVAQRGLRGYAVASEEIIKPHYRVLGREAGSVYMEIRPREPLAPGEYAVLGSDLARVATFRIKAATTP